MRFDTGRLRDLAAMGLLVILCGCGEGKPSVSSSTTEATIKGTVAIRGKPVDGGIISFDPSNFKRKTEPARTAAINKDGSYEVKTLLGLNQVTFSGSAFARERALQDASLQYDVQAGEQTFNIELPPPGATH